MSAPAGQPSARRRAHVRVYEHVQAIQAGDTGAAAELATLVAEAASRGWSEVMLAGMFGEAIDAWFRRDGRVATLVARLLERSLVEGDQAMLAVGLALRADPSVSGADDATASRRDGDLVRAMVLLEGGGGDVLARITAHTACGIALYHRGLFELGDEQYKAALDAGSTEEPEVVEALVAPVVFDRAELQVAWAAVLFQLGELDALEQRQRTWAELDASASRLDLPDAWQDELHAFGLLLRSMVGQDCAAEARACARRQASQGGGGGRSEGLFCLASAVCDVRAGRASADEDASAAAGRIDVDLFPHLYDLALHLLAVIEARRGTGAGLRYARRQLEQSWGSRLAALASMSARIDAERLASERELLSRHARLDDLTGVGNRRALEVFLGDLDRRGVRQIALILLDVDRFKEVNDRYGHLAGDSVLVAIAGILQQSVRPCDLAVRLGGDEFAVVLADVTIDVASQRALDCLACIDAQRFESGRAVFAVSASAGIAVGDPAGIVDLRAEADAALYRAKAGAGQRPARSRLVRATD